MVLLQLCFSYSLTFGLFSLKVSLSSFYLLFAAAFRPLTLFAFAVTQQMGAADPQLLHFFSFLNPI